MNPEGPAAARAFEQAVRAQRQGLVHDADALCASALEADPGHFAAWHLRALLALEGGRLDQGIDWLERSLALNPDQASAYSNLGNAWLTRQQPHRALGCLERALHLKPDYTVALFNRGNALRALRRLEEALDSYQQALRLKSDYPPALNNQGLVLLELGRPEEAAAAFGRAVQLEPRFAEAHRNLAASLLTLGRAEQALGCYDALLVAAPRDADAWCGRGNALLALRRLQEARGSFTQALQLDASHLESLINRGLAFFLLHQPAVALDDYERALQLSANSVLALNNSGNALLEMGDAGAALARYERALELSPSHPDSLYNRGAALRTLKRLEESARSFAELLRVAPEHHYALGNLLHLRLDCCDWLDYARLTQQLHEALSQNKRAVNPLSLLLSDDAQLQLRCAQVFAQEKYASQGSLGRCAVRAGRGAGERLRVAYVSADFGEHPVSHLLVGVLEGHDRERFEVLGVSLRAGGGGQFEQRVRGAFDGFIEVSEQSDQQVAQRLRELQVDVAVDLMGYTQGLRLGIFAHRAAAVQVNYLGYAGTLGAPYMDYIIGDAVVIPAGEEGGYSESVVRLPHSYLPNDDRREIAEAPTREQAGLPQGALVLCAFTNAYKINPPVFEVWMRLLRATPGSVLWLRGMGEPARGNLRREAEQRGVGGERLVFAPHVAGMAQHLGRQTLADLYLDTQPYNAHSTACDALWAGVPVLTCAGRSFAARVAASALTAVGLPQLITHTLGEYEARALELLADASQLRQLRAQLKQQRHEAALFDTAAYCRHLESAYLTMHQRAASGQTPAGFDVAPVRP
jgi:protein O-GlcNAc transferase